MRKPSPLAVGMTTFFVCIVVFAYVVGPVACSDSWVSPSIGRQGACSWHGGVSYIPLYLGVLVSLVMAFVSSNIAARFGRKSDVARTVPQFFRVGAQVYHPLLGYGKVMQTEGDGCETKLLVSFGGNRKKLHLETALRGGLRVTRH